MALQLAQHTLGSVQLKKYRSEPSQSTSVMAVGHADADDDDDDGDGDDEFENAAGAAENHLPETWIAVGLLSSQTSPCTDTVYAESEWVISKAHRACVCQCA